ncbi:MAG TPA: hypothetical protein VHA73_08810 [Acidimicrobiales bacterium]|jgi:energy-coupling factor transporter ATP-binding protein EcfA2|nr:hypothetical protein [Acidimicrobiales bacterium]
MNGGKGDWGASQRERARERRRAELGVIASAPEHHSWPDAYLAQGRLIQGTRGVPLKAVAEALGCHYQTVRPLLGEEIGRTTFSTRPVPNYDPALLWPLRTHPKVLASREQRARALQDHERRAEIQAYFSTVGNYQVTRANVEGFRCIYEAVVPVSPLTVLAGRNGAGKTSLLNALALSPATDGLYGDDRHPSDVIFEVQGTALPTAPDPDLVGWYLAIGLDDAVAEVFVPLAAKVLREATLVGWGEVWRIAVPPRVIRESRQIICQYLSDHPKSGSSLVDEWFETVVESDEESAEILSRFQVNGPSVTTSSLTPDTETIGQRLLEVLPSLARPLVGDLQSTVTTIALGECDERPGFWEDHARSAIGWEDRYGVAVCPGRATHVRVRGIDSQGDDAWAAVGDRQSLITLTDRVLDLAERNERDDLHEVAAFLRLLAHDIGTGGPTNQWFAESMEAQAAVRASLLAVEAVANELAPDFLAEAGRIVILPPEHLAVTQLAVGLVDVRGEFTMLHALSSGLARWVCLVTDLAISDVRSRFRSVAADAPCSVDSEDLSAVIRDRVLAVRPTVDMTHLLLADEPELHLHPRAQQDVVRWCIEMSRRWTTIVATHAQPFLRLAPGQGQVLRVVRDPEWGTQVRSMQLSIMESMNDVADDLGLGWTRVAELVKGVVVVEGEADKCVLEAFGAKTLTDNRLVVIPIGGHSKARALVEGQLAAALRLPIAVLFDDVTREQLKVIAGDPHANVTDEVRSVHRVLGLRERGVPCASIPFDEPDVIAALPEACMRAQFAGFESWAVMRETWDPAWGSFKNHVLHRLGVARRDDFSTIQAVVADWDGEALPPSYQRVLKALSAWGENLGVHEPHALA